MDTSSCQKNENKNRNITKYLHTERACVLASTHTYTQLSIYYILINDRNYWTTIANVCENVRGCSTYLQSIAFD